MYVTNVKWTVAIDAVTGKQIWRTPVDFAPDTPRVVCCGVSNKGVAIYEGKVFRTTLDAHVVALDKKTGKQIWKQKVGRVEGRLFADGRAARRQRRAHHRHLRRGVRHPRLPRRLGSRHRQEAVAPLHDRRAGREGPRDVGAARVLPERRREHLDHGLVRSRARSRLLGHRQRRRVEPGQPQGRQPLRRLRDRDPAEDRRDRLALPVRAERRVRLGFAVGADPRRHPRRAARSARS